MYAKNVFAAGALISAVAAVPMANKRDIVWVSETEVAVVTVPVTTTVWVNPGESVPTTQAHYGHHSHSTKTTHVQSTVTVQPYPSSSAESSAEETSTAPAPSSYEAPSSSSVYVAPTTSSTSVYVAPTPTSTYVAPTTSSTSVYVAPTPSSTYVAPTTSAAATTTSASSGGSGTSPAGAVYTGDITHWDVGLGSCGWTNTDTEMVVAIPEDMMDNPANPNLNPKCGTYITIKYEGKETQAKIVDTCGGCLPESIDLSPSLFSTVAPDGDGRVHDVEWWYNSS